jgi:integrase
MTAEGCSPRTIAQRTAAVQRLAATTDPVTTTTQQVTDWIAAPNTHTGRTRSAATIDTYWRDLNAWYDHIVAAGHLTTSPMAGLRRPPQPKGIPRPLPTDDYRHLVATAHGNLLAWLMLGLREGLRTAEIARFRGDQIEGDWIVAHGKGGRIDMLPLHPCIADLAGDYPRSGYWFPGRGRYPHVWPESVTRAVREHFRAHGVPAGAVHRLRHTYGTELIRSGANVRVVQRLMRHANLATTARYAEAAPEEAAEAVRRLPAPDAPDTLR